jgi:glycosyltransferase involved in cell wall biosynthesis
MKIVVICSTLDLKYRLGCTPSWWQLLKAFHETGHDVIAIPYLGDPIESLWWRTYPNPCSTESKLYNRFLELKKTVGFTPSTKKERSNRVDTSLDNYIKSKWEKHLLSILEREENVDCVLFINIPLNHVHGIPTKIQQLYGIPVAFYEGDMPTILPKYAADRGFKFNYYVNADLSEFDAFFTNSKGVIFDLKEMGARNVHPMYYAADPDLFRPVEIEKDIDISFFGYGDSFREEWMRHMIVEPSKKMPDTHFSVAGGGFSIDLGNAKYIGDLSFSDYRNYCCKSKICLNITRWSHTNVYASSTARPFELAAFGACMVSQPYNGIEEWFEPGKEIIVLKETDNIEEIYSQLLSSPDQRMKIGEKAREKILQSHTYNHRAQDITQSIRERN